MRRMLVLLAAASVAAQQPPPAPRIGESIEVSIVNLDVVVTDRKGNRVRGLTPRDFEVKEEGKVRVISNFAEYDAAPPPESTTGESPASPPADRRIIVLFVERARLKPPASDRIFGTLEEAVRRVVRPGDSAAVVFWDQRMEIKQDFTDDVEALTAAVREIREINKRLTLRDARSLSDRQLEQERLDDMLAGTGVSLNIMTNESIMLARRTLMQIRAKTHALRSLIGLMAPAEGKKIMFMATRRYSSHAGAEFFAGATMPAEYRHEFDTASLAKGLADAANAAGVTIYPVYPPGLVDESSPTAADIRPMGSDADRGAFDWNVLSNEGASLGDLARSTGGLYAAGAGDIAAMIPKVVDDLQTYYSIAFRVEPGGRKERRIAVRALNAGYSVRARRSYVRREEREQMSDRVVAHLFWPVAPNHLGIHAELIPLKATRNRTTLQARVHIPIAQLSPLRQGDSYSGAFTVFAAAGGGQIGVVSDAMQRTQPYRISAGDLARARRSHYTYDLTVVTDDQAEYVSLGVLDEVSKEFSVIRLPLPATSGAD